MAQNNEGPQKIVDKEEELKYGEQNGNFSLSSAGKISLEKKRFEKKKSNGSRRLRQCQKFGGNFEEIKQLIRKRKKKEEFGYPYFDEDKDEGVGSDDLDDTSTESDSDDGDDAWKFKKRKATSKNPLEFNKKPPTRVYHKRWKKFKDNERSFKIGLNDTSFGCLSGWPSRII